MSTLLEALPELDTQAVAQRLRMFMGDKKLSRAKLAMASGISRTSLGTKLDGEVEFTLADISAIAAAIDRHWLWVLTGSDPDPRGDDDVARPKGFEPLTF